MAVAGREEHASAKAPGHPPTIPHGNGEGQPANGTFPDAHIYPAPFEQGLSGFVSGWSAACRKDIFNHS